MVINGMLGANKHPKMNKIPRAMFNWVALIVIFLEGPSSRNFFSNLKTAGMVRRGSPRNRECRVARVAKKR